jgi:carboxymethylenebutenolidase
VSPVSHDAIQAETITITGHGGDQIEAYRAVPLAPGPRAGLVWIHHMPGYDRETKEFVRRLAVDGYQVVVPNLYSREAPGADPDDAAATVRAAGGVPDERLVGDVAGAADYLRGLDGATGKIGVIGHCSGGRHTFLAACSLSIDAAVDCYGAFVTGTVPEGFPMKVTNLVDNLPDLGTPLLGLFGADDAYPSPEQVAELDQRLTGLGKEFEFHSYEGAGHAFFAVDRVPYNVAAANDGWERITAFYAKHLGA